MSKFEHLKRLQITSGGGATCTYELYEIEGVDGRVPKIHMRIAGEQNKGYWAAVRKRAVINGKRFRGGTDPDGRQTDEVRKANRESDRKLFPEFVVVGWEDMPGDDGQAVPFSREACADFFQQIPDWIFDRITNHAENPVNHLALTPAPDEREDVAGN